MKLFNTYPIGIILISFFICAYKFASGQDDSLIQDYKKEFENFKVNSEAQFNKFKRGNDSIFLNYLQDSWKEFELFKSERVPKPKPQEQPRLFDLKKSKDSIPSKDKLHFKNGARLDDYEENKLEGNTNPDRSQAMLDYYGTDLSNCIAPGNYPSLQSLTSEHIHQFFKNASLDVNLNTSIQSLKSSADVSLQNDWGYLNLLKKASHSIYTINNDRVLFVWYALLRSGFNVRLGFNQKNTFLLISSDNQIYKTSYFEIEETKFYLMDIAGEATHIDIIMVHEKGYPDAKNPISFLMKTLPVFNPDLTKRYLFFEDDAFAVLLNRNLINYLNDYPDLELSSYFQVPLSTNVLAVLERYFEQKFEGKTQVQKVNTLLEFIQSSIDYKSDIDQFGYENYMFADEVLFYPFADCEDRSVLFSYLVRTLIGYKTIGLNYPQHVSVGVAFNLTIEGDFVIDDGTTYYICDPTYLGARCGQCPKELQSVEPLLIQYD